MLSRTTQIAVGAVLLLVGSALILGVGLQQVELPGAVGGVAAMVMAVGTLLLGTSEGGRPV
ncbi:hypothetical protein [Halorientalis halophila]|uniref:hypothetical protein n=1 Tax=Halorientalis halophila TaxID=3108499 RepID=UPI003009A62D